MTNAAIFLAGDDASDDHRDEELGGEERDGSQIVRLVLLDILGDRLLQRIARKTTIHGETTGKRRQFGLIRDAENDDHAGSVLRPGEKENGNDIVLKTKTGFRYDHQRPTLNDRRTSKSTVMVKTNTTRSSTSTVMIKNQHYMIILHNSHDQKSTLHDHHNK